MERDIKLILHATTEGARQTEKEKESIEAFGLLS